MSKFKVGDKVTIVKGSMFDGLSSKSNPPHGVIGEVIMKVTDNKVLGCETYYLVSWPNGENYYISEDLEYYDERSNYHPHHDLIVAWAKGAKIQSFCEGEWFNASNPRWSLTTKYRIKPSESKITPQQLEKQAIEEEMRKLADRLKELD